MKKPYIIIIIILALLVGFIIGINVQVYWTLDVIDWCNEQLGEGKWEMVKTSFLNFHCIAREVIK